MGAGPLVLAHVSLTPDPPPSPPRADEAMEVEAVIPRISNGDEDKCIGEAGRIRRTTLSITNLRQRNIDDNAAGQWCHGDLGVYVDGSRLIVDVAVADATAPSYRRPRIPTASTPSRRVPVPRTAPPRRSREATPPPRQQQRSIIASFCLLLRLFDAVFIRICMYQHSNLLLFLLPLL